MWLAYTLQAGGSEACRGHVVHLETGNRHSAGDLQSVVSIEWLQDGTSFLYTVADSDGRPHKVRTVGVRSVPVATLQIVVRAVGRVAASARWLHKVRGIRLPRCAGHVEAPQHTGTGHVHAGGA